MGNPVPRSTVFAGPFSGPGRAGFSRRPCKRRSGGFSDRYITPDQRSSVSHRAQRITTGAVRTVTDRHVWRFLTRIDEDLAARQAREPCPHCGVVRHSTVCTTAAGDDDALPSASCGLCTGSATRNTAQLRFAIIGPLLASLPPIRTLSEQDRTTPDGRTRLFSIRLSLHDENFNVKLDSRTDTVQPNF